MGCIYIATNKVNGKSYIGQTIGKLSVRKSRHHDSVREGSLLPFHRAIRKHGKHAFEWSKLEDGIDDIDKLNELEVKYIKEYGTLCHDGYNLQSGGKNCTHSHHTIKKMKDSRIGKSNGNVGRTLDTIIMYARVRADHGHFNVISQRDSMRLVNGSTIVCKYNLNDPIHSINHTKSLHNKYYETRKAKSNTCEEKAKRKIWNAKAKERLLKDRGYAVVVLKKKVIRLNDGIVYDSMTQAAKDINVKREKIRLACNGKSKTVKGYRYSFA